MGQRPGTGAWRGRDAFIVAKDPRDRRGAQGALIPSSSPSQDASDGPPMACFKGNATLRRRRTDALHISSLAVVAGVGTG